MLWVLMSGCFSHVPITPAAAPPGQEVVVHLSPAAAQRVGEEAGYPVRALRGQVESVRADTVALSVWTGSRYRGAVIADHRRTHVLTASDIVYVSQPVLNRQRTALLGAGVVAGLILVLNQALGGTGGDQPPTDPPISPAPAFVPRPIR